MRNAIIKVEDDDDDFLAQVAAAEADALSAKRRKITATTTVTKTANLSQANTNKEEGAEGTDTAALRGSRSLLFQQQISRATGRVKGSVAGNSIINNNNNVFANPEFGGGGSTVGGGGVGGGSCFKCGKSGHWARDCDANSIAVVDPWVPEKACPCGLGSCIVLTANTQKNRGRQFYKCPLREENGGCGFFEWCDKNIGTDNMTVRSQRYASNQSHASNPSIPELSCLCGAGPCLILTAKTGKNIGQMFYRCPASQGSSCGFFKWCHDHTIQGGSSAPVNAAKVHKTNEMSSNSLGVRSGSCCFKCGKDGHWAKDCPAHSIQKPADHRGGNTASPVACY